MPTQVLKAFMAELESVKGQLARYPKKTLRDRELLERIRLLGQTWMMSVAPAIEPLLKDKKQSLKLSDAIRKIAQLTSKCKPLSDYRARISGVIRSIDSLALYTAVTADALPTGVKPRGSDLFLPEIPDLPLSLVPNPLVGWLEQIRLFVQKHGFDKSVFIMIRYRERNNSLVTSIKEALADHNLYGIVASEHRITDDLYNPVACLLACSRGVAVFDEPERRQEFNPNVAYELGMLQMLNRQCLILKHESLKTLHTDILMKLYEPYDSAASASTVVRQWLDKNQS